VGMTQIEYIDILFIDCNFNSARQRKDFIFQRFKKNFPDELTVKERSALIDELKEIKGAG